ncbi:MAG: disulfide isomerase DsbC N-terminal domain-containing protein, partial [Glaciecola sp.]
MYYINRLITASRLVVISAMLSAFVFSARVNAAQESATQEGAAEQHADLIRKFEQKLNFKIISVADSNVPGLLQINTNTGIFYGSENGEYFLSARIYRVGDEIVDETGAALQKYRLQGIERFKDSAIEFKSEKEKYIINVFTD